MKKEPNWESLSDEERHEWAADIAESENYVDELTMHLKNGQRIDPRDIALALRYPYVDIPQEIRDYVADILLNGRGSGRYFRLVPKINNVFYNHDLKERYKALTKEGIKSLDAIDKVAEESGLTDRQVSQIVHPRRNRRRL